MAACPPRQQNVAIGIVMGRKHDITFPWPLFPLSVAKIPPLIHPLLYYHPPLLSPLPPSAALYARLLLARSAYQDTMMSFAFKFEILQETFHIMMNTVIFI